MTTATLPTGKGTYILILRLDESAQLTIGKLGTFAFPAGWYAYVGSAFGPGGLRGRLKHHLAPVINPHWHIDYLRQTASTREVWYLVSATVYEHEWAAALASYSRAAIPVPRFGASDCRCETHLIHFSELPDFAEFQGDTGQPIQRWYSGG
ncbi:MAG: GIY-YIG nuclease family protein [Anaerolineaceae bacterium]|nr:GIY-YIG nuclease family protein [Anaerolineaceae bacterium]